MVDSEQTIYIPGCMKRRKKRQGDEIQPIPVVSLKSEPPALPGDLTDISDELYGACNNETEREVLRLKAHGYTLSEIGEQVGLQGHTRVSRILKEIEKRFYHED